MHDLLPVSFRFRPFHQALISLVSPPHMHREYMPCIRMAHEIIHPPKELLLLEQIQRKERHVNLFTLDLAYLILVIAAHHLIVGLAFIFPVPPVQIPRVKYGHLLQAHKKRHALIRRAKSPDLHPIQLYLLTGLQINRSAFRPPVRNITGQNIFDILICIRPLEYLSLKMIIMPMACEYIHFFLCRHIWKPSLIVIKYHDHVFMLDCKTTVFQIRNFHFLCLSLDHVHSMYQFGKQISEAFLYRPGLAREIHDQHILADSRYGPVEHGTLGQFHGVRPHCLRYS